MLQAEEKIRMSPEYSEQCTQVKNEVNGWLRISGEIQQKIAFDFGYKDTLKNMLVVNQMRRAPYLYADDERFLKPQVYVRHNRAKDSVQEIGQIIPDINIYSLDGKRTNLYSVLDSEKSNLIIASSET